MLFSRRRNLRLSLFILLVLSVILMVLDHRQKSLIGVRKVLSSFVAPLQYSVGRSAEFFSDIRIFLTRQNQLIKENQYLHKQALVLKIELQKLSSLSQENNQLRLLLSSSRRIYSHRILTAQLLRVDTGPLVSEMIIDKGKQDEAFVGQPVIDANGIVGQIIEVGLLTSRVMLLTDLRSAIPVQATRTGIRGLVMGKGKLANLSLVNIPHTVDIRVGDILTSSGLGGRYLAGYAVGVVSAVDRPPDEQFTHIQVRPKAALDRSQHVLLIWPGQTPQTSSISIDKK